MVLTASELSGLQKASILLVSLSSAASAEVLRHLSPTERELLGSQIVKMSSVQSVVKHRVLEEASELVKRSSMMEIVDIDSIIDSSDAPLKWLERLDPMEVADTLSKERPHSIALVVSHLSPGAAANVLSYLGEKTRGAVLQRLSAMGPVSEEAVKAVDEVLKERARGKFESIKGSSQVSQTLLKAFGDVTSKAKESMLGALSRTEQSAPAGLITMPSSTEDMTVLSDSDIREVLREIDMEDVSLVLGVASEALRDAVLRNIPDAIASVIRAGFEGQFQIKVRDIELAQARIVEAMCRLTGEGRIGGALAVSEAAA